MYKRQLYRIGKLVGAAFCIGEEDAIFITGAIPASTVDETELDRILGTLWVTVEQNFKSLLKIGFASKFDALNKEDK